MRNPIPTILMLALAGCTTTKAAFRDPANAPQEAVVQSETARQALAKATASGASPDQALDKAAAENPPTAAPKR